MTEYAASICHGLVTQGRPRLFQLYLYAQVLEYLQSLLQMLARLWLVRGLERQAQFIIAFAQL